MAQESLTFLLDEVTEGHQLEVPVLDALEREAFRTDAKAQGEDVVVAGRETLHSTNPKECRWFAVRLTRQNASWVFRSPGEPLTSTASWSAWAP